MKVAEQVVPRARYAEQLERYVTHPSEARLEALRALGGAFVGRGIGLDEVGHLHCQAVEGLSPEVATTDRLSAALSAFMEGYENALRRLMEERLHLEAEAHRAKVAELSRQHALELERVTTEFQDFAYTVSHDLLGPLRGIRNYASWLAEDNRGTLPESSAAMLTGLVDLSGRMKAMMDALLRFSRLGSVELDIQPVDLQELVTRIAAHPDVAGLEVRTREPLPTAPCDPELIGSVFLALFTNALQYNDSPKPRVTVGWRQRGGRLAIWVVDNGIGIAEEYLDDIFRLFRRLHVRGEYGEGIGAGLTLARRVVRRHGGEMWAESTEGRGTAFWFDLPPEEAAAVNRPTDGEAPPES